MQSNHTKPQHPVADSPYQLHLFKQKDFVSLSGCCAKPAFCCSLNLYITAYDPFADRETEMDLYSCAQCGTMYVAANGLCRKLEHLLKYEVRGR